MTEVTDLFAQLRLDTPGAAEVLHFNNAGSALPASSTIEAQVRYIQREGVVGGYELAESSGGVVDLPYSGLAGLLRVGADEIGFCNNASDAWRRVLSALPLPSDAHIVFDESIYGGNLAALIDGRERYGWRLTPVRINRSGTIDEVELERVLTGGAELLALTHMPAQSGAVNELSRVSRLAREHGALTIVDACQTLGHVPIDLAATAVDGLIFTGRKYLRAPRGTGGFVVRTPLLERLRPTAPDLRAATVGENSDLVFSPGATRLEQWERNWALHAGLGAAIEYLRALDIDVTWRRIQDLSGALVTALGEVAGVEVRRRSAETGGIVVFDLPGHDLVQARDWLRARGANVMFAGPQNAPLEMRRLGEKGWLRASVHYFNTEDEIEDFARLVQEFIKQR